MSFDMSTDEVAERLTALIEALPDAIFFKDGAGHWLVVNSAGLRLFGLLGRAWKGRTDLELAELYPAYADAYRACQQDDEKAWQHGSRFDAIEYVTDPDCGKLHTFEVTKVPLFYSNGSRRGLVVIGHDVTSRVALERRLAESETQLRTIIETEPECVKLMAEDGTVLQMNRAGLDMLGAETADDVIGTPASAWIAPEYRVDFDNLTKRVYSGESGRLEFEVISLTGVHRWLESNAVPLRDMDGAIAALLSVTRDITERKKAELALQESEERFRNVIDNNSIGMGIVSLDGKFMRVNGALCEITGYSAKELGGMTVGDITHSDDMPEQTRNIQRLLTGTNSSYQMEKRYVHKDGHAVWVQLTVSIVCDAKDKPLYFVGQVENITSRKEAELALRESEKKFRSMFELSPVGMALNDLSTGQFIEANPSLLRSTGYTADEFYALSYWDVTPPQYEAQEQKQLESLRSVGQYGPYEKEYIRKDGKRFPVLLRGVRLTDNTGRELILSIIQDISERKAAEEEIHKLAYHDPLTNLANRRLLTEQLRKALYTGARRGIHGAVLFIDLDNFKLLNDTKGHDVGDLLLVEMAHRLSAAVRKDDTVARLGGDEFVVVLENLSQEPALAATQAKRVGEKIRALLNKPFMLDEHAHQITPSIGVSLFDGTVQSADELLKNADIALYNAKNAGRNRVSFFDPAMQATLDARAEMEEALHEALRENQFELHYQLQVNEGAQFTCAEVLLRWIDPKRGLVMPDDFIPLAEETGLIIPIGHWVLESACKKLKEWEANPVMRNVRLAVNVSSRQFHQRDFVNEVHAVLRKTGVEPSRLKLELTESLVLKDIDDTIEKMHALKSIGVGLSMDDFGTGYSSLSYLVQLPFEEIKIDRSFIRDMATTRAHEIMVETIINMVKSLELEVIAEGVETEAQYNTLNALGCSSFQGYIFGRPVPSGDFESTVLSMHAGH